MRLLCSAAIACVLAVTGCANSTPLIMDKSVSADVRQAATCYSFNAHSDKYLFGVQRTMNDYVEAASFWEKRFIQVEPDSSKRSRLIRSASEKMDDDFPRRSAPDDENVMVFNAGYGAVIVSCERHRTEVEGA